MLFNRINTDALDRIIINVDDTKKISEVINIIYNDITLNKKLMDVESTFDDKGIITYVSSPTVSFYYNLKNKGVVELSEVDDNGKISFRVTFDTQLNPINIQRFENNLMLSDKYIAEISRATVILLVDFMKYAQYMSYMKQENPIVIKRAAINNTNKSSNGNHANGVRSTVSVSKPKKIYDYEQADRKGDKRSYERHTGSWEVAGHWRHYKKSGKKVFVKGHKKGKGVKKGKDYTI